MTPLDQWLGHWYRASVLKTRDKDETIRLFATAIEADQDLRSTAEARLAEVDALMKKRKDFISEVHLEGLRKALSHARS